MNYFEYIILLVQDYILIVIVLFYRKEITKKTLIIFGSYAFFVLLFAGGVLPKSILTFFIVSGNFEEFSKIQMKYLYFSRELSQCQQLPKSSNSSKF
jgi:hypothetical protein